MLSFFARPVVADVVQIHAGHMLPWPLDVKTQSLFQWLP